MLVQLRLCSANGDGKDATHTKPRREVTHEGKNRPRVECGTVNHTPTNTTARPRMGVSPVKGVGRKGGPVDVAERLPDRDVHHCDPGISCAQRRSCPSFRRADLCTKALRSGDKFGAGKLLALPNDPPGYIYHPVRKRST